MLLNCSRFNGEDEFQIYIDVERGYVLYNAQLIHDGNYERTREVVTIGKDGETTLVDLGLDITMNNNLVIQANDENSTFLLAKGTATFAYAWTTLLPPGNNGQLVAWGNSHDGKCSTNPFVQSQ